VVADIESWLTKFKYNYNSHFTLDLHLNPFLRSMIQRGWISQRLKWLLSYRLNIHIMADDTLSMNDFKFMLHNSEIDITDVVLNDQPIEKAISEADLRGSNGSRKKADDPGLDYFKKDTGRGGGKEKEGDGRGQSRGDGRSGGGRGGPRGSQQRGRPQSRKGQDTQQEKKQGGQQPTQQSQRSGRDDDKQASGGRKEQAAAKQPEQKPSEQKQPEKKQPEQKQAAQKPPATADAGEAKKETSKKQAPSRPNPKAKYYKSSRDKDEDQAGQTGPGKSRDASGEDKGDSAREQDQPERKEAKKDDNAHLPSAIEVARQHRIEKEEQEKKDN
jgi:hypothetical protein